LIGVKVHDRHVMMAFATCIACAVIWQRIVFDSSGTISFGQILNAPLGAGEALALFALFSLISRMGNDTLLSRADLLLIAAAGAAFTLPSLKAGSIAMTPVAVMLITRRDARLASIGQLLLALAFYQLYGRLIFDFVAPYVLWLETGAVTGLLSFFGDFSQNGADIVAPSGHTIFIEPPCSAFHNITVATLIWLSLIKIERLQIVLSDWWTLGAMIAATILLNTIRIALMAQSAPMLQYWHDGQGVVIVSIVTLASLLGISLLSRVRPAAILA
jgi:hypothetical protein